MTANRAAEGPLPPGENQRIFRNEIVPAHFAGVLTQRAPVAVIIGGQTGAGKTAVTRMVKAALDKRGPCAWINMDFYNPHHPDYARWLAERPQEAASLVRPDGDLWWQQGQRYALEHGFDILLESAVASPAEFEDICAAIRSARLPDGVLPYRIEAAFVAVPPALSRLGVLTRYLDEVGTRGYGRLVEPAIHDTALQGVLRGAAAFENEHLGDFAQVFRRTGEVVFAGTVSPAGAPPEATAGRVSGLRQAIEAEHARVWSPAEAAWFTARHALAVLQAPEQALGELAEISALARPLLPGGPDRWQDVAAMATAARQAPAGVGSPAPTEQDVLLRSLGEAELVQRLATAVQVRFEALTRAEHPERSLLGTGRPPESLPPDLHRGWEQARSRRLESGRAHQAAGRIVTELARRIPAGQPAARGPGSSLVPVDEAAAAAALAAQGFTRMPVQRRPAASQQGAGQRPGPDRSPPAPHRPTDRGPER